MWLRSLGRACVSFQRAETTVASLSRNIEFIKYQLARTIKLQRKNASKGLATGPLDAIIEQFKNCLDAMHEAEQILASLPPPEVADQDRTVLKPDDIAGLPPELLAQLSLSESDLQDFELRKMISDCGGLMSLDHILIEQFRRTGEISDRGKLNSRLYRMVQKGLLHDVPKRRGVYTTVRPIPSILEGIQLPPLEEEGNEMT